MTTNPNTLRMRTYRAKQKAARLAAGWTDKRHGPKPEKRIDPSRTQSTYEAVARWRAANTEKARLSDRIYKGMKRSPSFLANWPLIVAHYGGKCLCCGSPEVAPDHVLSVLEDPDTRDTLANLQPLCRSCNSRKRDDETDYRPDRGAWIRDTLMNSHVPLHPCGIRYGHDSGFLED
jgi:5-methylcytosine-specific restriction endonuclease McrA